jgi:hypothetical protein
LALYLGVKGSPEKFNGRRNRRQEKGSTMFPKIIIVVVWEIDWS